MPKLTKEQIDEILRRFEAGKSKKEIARELNLSISAVIRHTPKLRAYLTQEQIQEIIRLVESGEQKKVVAHRFGVSHNAITPYTRHIRRQSPPTPPEIKAEAIRRILAGEQAASIARDLKINTRIVQKFAADATHKLKLPDTQKAAIQSAREDGKTVSQIASYLKIPIRIVNTVLGLRTSDRYSDELRQEVIRAIETGETAKSAAKRLGVSHVRASTWFSDAVAEGAAQRPEIPPTKYDDFQFTWITRQDPQLEEWRELIVSWFGAEKPSAGAAIDAITAFINRYLIAQNLPKKPADLLQRGRLLPDFYEKACPKSPKGRDSTRKIYDLIEWVLDSPGFADTSDGEPIRLTELYRNPINPNVGGNDGKRPNAESNKVVLPYHLISELRKRIAQGHNFKDWTWVQGLGGVETINGQQNASDWFEVTEDRIDRNDPDCVWRLRQRVTFPAVLEMWSPVRWVHALFHLQTTTRSGQARMIDSGEADTFIWKNENFIPNPGHLKQGTARKPRRQGVFRRPSPEDQAQGAKICLYFNTNKTADKGKTGTSKGFECAWPQMPIIDEDPYYWLAKLRDWQMKYNPIHRLTPWRELKGDVKLSATSEERAAEYPDAAFLFRAAEDSDHPHWPISSKSCASAWQKLLVAFENVLAKENFKHPSGEPIQLINPENGRAWSSPHATRTSLITHLILDGNVPPTIMMKIAGHARFIMTIYYTKAGLAGIQNAIRAGTEQIEATKFQTFERDLLGAKEEQMRHKAVFNAEDWKTILATNPADRNPLGWLHMHDGICLAGGNTAGNPYAPGCHTGGPAIIAANEVKKARHGPTPGGVRNCCRCRWKAVGKQHLLGLAATFDNRAYHMHKAKDEAIAAERERNRLMQDKARVETSNKPYDLMSELINTERRHEAAMHKFQELALDVAALHRTIERTMALPDNADGPTALAAQGDLLTVKMVLEETDSELLQLAQICAEVELFPDLDPGCAIFEFSQILDHAFEREGQPLILARFSEMEKLAAANAIMRELERRANRENPILGRRRVVEIMERGESLEEMLGVKLNSILQLTTHSGKKQVSLRLVKSDLEEDNDDHRAS